jgi:hypothetical protein
MQNWSTRIKVNAHKPMDCWATLSTVIEHYNKLQNVQQIPKLEKKYTYKIQFQKVGHNIGHTTKFHMWKVQTGNYCQF